MKRQCFIYKSASSFGVKYKRHICIDVENADDIFEIIKTKEKWKYIVERTLTQPFLHWDCYDKEKVDDKTGNVAAIKFFDADNTRIYCQELRGAEGNFFIICAIVLLRKKVQRNNSEIKQIIQRISKYEYEIIQEED